MEPYNFYNNITNMSKTKINLGKCKDNKIFKIWNPNENENENRVNNNIM